MLPPAKCCPYNTVHCCPYSRCLLARAPVPPNVFSSPGDSCTRPSPQTILVDLFMQELYESAAEPLPDGFIAGPGPWEPDTLEGAADQNAEVWLGSVCLPEQICQLSAPALGVPVRHMPHGRLHDLYLQFLAWHEANLSGQGVEGVAGVAEADRPASYSTFWRHWKAKWACCLKFRKVSQHSCCQVCFDFKQAMRSCRGDLGKKLHHASRLREHLRAQYHDRCMYWSLRWASRQRQQVLSIIIDSMDKTKFGVPRYPFSDKPKELDGFVRPKLVCTAALAHGWVTSVFLNDDVVNHGADAFVEVVLQVLEQVSQVSQETGRPMPEHLEIQADNTSSQCKNSLATTFMALMVARCKFVTTNLFFLRVGHTHEDVGSWPNVNVAKNTQHLKG